MAQLSGGIVSNYKPGQFDHILVRLPFFMLFLHSIFIDTGNSGCECTELCLDIIG